MDRKRFVGFAAPRNAYVTCEFKCVETDAMDQNGEECHADVQTVTNQQNQRYRDDAENAGMGEVDGHFVEAFGDIHARQTDSEKSDVGKHVNKTVYKCEWRVDDIADITPVDAEGDDQHEADGEK